MQFSLVFQSSVQTSDVQVNKPMPFVNFWPRESGSIIYWLLFYVTKFRVIHCTAITTGRKSVWQGMVRCSPIPFLLGHKGMRHLPPPLQLSCVLFEWVLAIGMQKEVCLIEVWSSNVLFNHLLSVPFLQWQWRSHYGRIKRLEDCDSLSYHLVETYPGN